MDIRSFLSQVQASSSCQASSSTSEPEQTFLAEPSVDNLRNFLQQLKSQCSLSPTRATALLGLWSRTAKKDSQEDSGVFFGRLAMLAGAVTVAATATAETSAGAAVVGSATSGAALSSVLEGILVATADQTALSGLLGEVVAATEAASSAAAVVSETGVLAAGAEGLGSAIATFSFVELPALAQSFVVAGLVFVGVLLVMDPRQNPDNTEPGPYGVDPLGVADEASDAGIEAMADTHNSNSPGGADDPDGIDGIGDDDSGSVNVPIFSNLAEMVFYLWNNGMNEDTFIHSRQIFNGSEGNEFYIYRVGESSRIVTFSGAAVIRNLTNLDSELSINQFLEGLVAIFKVLEPKPLPYSNELIAQDIIEGLIVYFSFRGAEAKDITEALEAHIDESRLDFDTSDFYYDSPFTPRSSPRWPDLPQAIRDFYFEAFPDRVVSLLIAEIIRETFRQEVIAGTQFVPFYFIWETIPQHLRDRVLLEMDGFESDELNLRVLEIALARWKEIIQGYEVARSNPITSADFNIGDLPRPTPREPVDLDEDL